MNPGGGLFLQTNATTPLTSVNSETNPDRCCSDPHHQRMDVELLRFSLGQLTVGMCAHERYQTTKEWFHVSCWTRAES